MARTLEKYSAKMVREFYANYFATMEQKVKDRQRLKDQPKLESVMVRGHTMDISKCTISWVLYGTQFLPSYATAEFEYRVDALKRVK